MRIQLRSEKECGELINNPVEIEDYEALKGKNDFTSHDSGREDGKQVYLSIKKYMMELTNSNGIGDGYVGVYQWAAKLVLHHLILNYYVYTRGIIVLINPDNVGCIEFLHNATNKLTEITMSVSVRERVIPVQISYVLKKPTLKNTASSGTVRYSVKQSVTYAMMKVM